MSSAPASLVQLGKSLPSLSTCTICADGSLSTADSSRYQRIGIRQEMGSMCDQTLAVPQNIPPTACGINKNKYLNVGPYASRSAGNLLYDDDELTPLVSHTRRPYSTANLLEDNNKFAPLPPHKDRLSRPRHHKRSATLPPRLTIPHHTVAIPNPLPTSNSLYEGPRGYQQAPVTSRNNMYESLRDDHGIRFKKQSSVVQLLLHWDHLTDEDAAPMRLHECFIRSAGRKRESVKRWIKKRLGFLRKK